LKRLPSAPLTAFVLHSHDWSESSLIVELFTRERGRLVVAAKGAKRPTSQLRPVLLPFQRLNVLLGRTPVDDSNEVHLLRSAEWAGGVPVLAGGALFRAFYVNELLLKLLARQDPHPLLFDAYALTLPALAGDESAAGAAALRAFELLLLRETGVLPDLDRVTQTHQPLRANAAYRLDAEAGVADASADPAIPGSTLLALAAALASGELGALQAACLPALPALRLQLRALLQYHLGSAALRTRQVMLEVQRLMPSPESG
jgi:DNA repair protein RecO (recombination protein O)